MKIRGKCQIRAIIFTIVITIIAMLLWDFFFPYEYPPRGRKEEPRSPIIVVRIAGIEGHLMVTETK